MIDFTRGDDLPDVDLETLPKRRRRAIPAPPTSKNRPKVQFGPLQPVSGAAPPTRDEDPSLWAVHDELMRLDPTGSRTAFAIREAFDQAYDGLRTGRWDYSQLMKTEKTHIGTLVEMWLQREFRFEDGRELDYRIAGEDVDAKWSRNLYEWEIPPEMYERGNKIALVVWANEYTIRWALGLLRISESGLLPMGKQRDRKRRVNDEGRDSILWVHRDKVLIKNTLLHLPDDVVEEIRRSSSGQQAITTLFRHAQGELVDRAAVVAAGQQIDSAKRVRDARRTLAHEGIVIFGHYQPHPDYAAALGLPRPTLGRFVSARLAPWQEGDPEPFVEIAGILWRVARDDDEVVTAPALPEQGGIGA
ncbi:NaeI family type II restriction endonuclease [Kribbia dieselivorans]|uniref:NaeI family type II restriction endonuclease n=1 Tax=Kribbia dieselivorans TaxID=331526 RepID=UPI0012EDB5EC|nr:NaeI family type II restriction endonuclease [Kribbia dieselivorans]